jgi:hypothetical protein
MKGNKNREEDVLDDIISRVVQPRECMISPRGVRQLEPHFIYTLSDSIHDDEEDIKMPMLNSQSAGCLH